MWLGKKTLREDRGVIYQWNWKGLLYETEYLVGVSVPVYNDS